MNNCNCNAYNNTSSNQMPRRKHPSCNQELAMAYVPFQNFVKLYELDQGFCKGTIFQELDKPFRGFKGGYSC
ncbi:MAG: spore coat associated protein CotJA [Lachnospiraceae bacterium]|nr:spore coat associated protein CotJA [Lachnospiraceae bacterium]